MNPINIQLYIKRSIEERKMLHSKEDHQIYDGLEFTCLLPNHDLTCCAFVSKRLKKLLHALFLYQPIDICNLTSQEFKSQWNAGKTLCDEMVHLLHQCGLDWTPSRQTRYLRDFTDQEIFDECEKRKMYARDEENSKKKQLLPDVLLLSKKAEAINKANYEFESLLSAYLDRIVKKKLEDIKTDLAEDCKIETSKVIRQFSISKRNDRSYYVYVCNQNEVVIIRLEIYFIHKPDIVATMTAFNEYMQDSKCKEIKFECSCLSIEIKPSIDETEQYIQKIVNTIMSYIKEKEHYTL